MPGTSRGLTTQAGHDRMWFVARDIAFEHPVTEDETTRMLVRMGIDRRRARPPRWSASSPGRPWRTVLPIDIDFTLEMVVGRMIGLLLIEISAFHGFRWAEALLGDPDLVAGDGTAGHLGLVHPLRRDASRRLAAHRPVRDAGPDLGGSGGRRHAGTEMIGLLWDRALSDSLGVLRVDGRT
jgi:hypothetical protein